MSSEAADIAEALDANYLDYQYLFVEFLIEHLVEVGRDFGGDYQSMLVLAVLGQARLASRRKVRSLKEEARRRQLDRTNASRIADITGIPRQTVRRKLEILEQRGWIERDASGIYRLVSAADGEATARAAFHDTDRRALYRVARLVTDLSRLVERHRR